MTAPGHADWRIVARRLQVRPWQPADLPALKRLSEDPDMMRHLTDGRPWGDADRQEFTARQARHLAVHGVCVGALCLKATDRVVGLAGIQPHDNVPGQFELAWWVWKDYWRRGFATEIGQALIDWAFTEMALTRIVAIADVGNTASRRVMEKLGMAYCGDRSAREFSARYPDRPVALYELRP